MSSSETPGPYASAVSMSWTPRSTARRRSARAAARSRGGPQVPGPVIRMAPNPRRRTSMSPPTAKVVFIILFDVTERFVSTLIRVAMRVHRAELDVLRVLALWTQCYGLLAQSAFWIAALLGLGACRSMGA